MFNCYLIKLIAINATIYNLLQNVEFLSKRSSDYFFFSSGFVGAGFGPKIQGI